jgi:uncharacterized repeat protein (TIGR02543 family)
MKGKFVKGKILTAVIVMLMLITTLVPSMALADSSSGGGQIDSENPAAAQDESTTDAAEIIQTDELTSEDADIPAREDETGKLTDSDSTSPVKPEEGEPISEEEPAPALESTDTDFTPKWREAVSSHTSTEHVSVKWVNADPGSAKSGLGTDNVVLEVADKRSVLELQLSRTDNNIEKYRLEITYTTNDSDTAHAIDPPADNTAGFDLFSYNDLIAVPSLAPVITGDITTSGTGNTRSLVYEELSLPASAPTYLNAIFRANRSVYDGQVLNVSAKLIPISGDFEQATATMTFNVQPITLRAEYDMNLSSSSGYVLTGNHTYPLKITAKITDNPSGATLGTVPLNYPSLGDVKIKIDNVEKTYAQILTDYAGNLANAPVLFFPPGANTSTPALSYDATTPITSVDSSVTIQVKTSTTFAIVNGNAPVITFPETALTSTPVVIGGHSYTFDSAESTYIVDNTAAKSWTGVDSVPATALSLQLQTFSSGSINWNSEQYKTAYELGLDEGHLYYQELCHLKLNYVTSSTPPMDIDVTIDVPNGVTITHMRLPKVAAGSAADFSGVEFGNGAAVSTSTSDYTVIDLASIGITPPKGGEKLTFTAKDLVKLGIQGSNNWASGLIYFIGITDDSVPYNTPANFKATVKDAANPYSSYSQSASSDLNANRVMDIHKGASLNKSGVVKGDSLRLAVSFSSVTEPWYSNSRLDMYNPKTVMTDPVVYVSMPAGLSVESYAMRDPNYLDEKGRPVTVRITNSWQNMGYFGATGGSLYEFTFMQDASKGYEENGHIYTVNSIVLDVDLRVTSDFSASDSIQFLRDLANNKASICFGSRLSESKLIGYDGGNVARSTEYWPAIANTTSKSTQYTSAETGSTIVTAPQALIVSGAASKGTDYTNYNPGSPTDTLPQIPVDTQGGNYKIYAYNGSPATSLSGSTYFVVPTTSKGGRVPITGAPTVNSGTAGTWAVYYTTDPITSQTAGLDGSDLTSSSEAIANWQPLTSGSGTGQVTPSLPGGLANWNQITALKIELGTFITAEDITVTMPYTTPQYDDESGIVDGADAIGATLHNFGSSYIKTNNLTAALKLSEYAISGLAYLDNDSSNTYDGDIDSPAEGVIITLKKAADELSVGEESGYLSGSSGSFIIHNLDETPLLVTAQMPADLAALGYYFTQPLLTGAQKNDTTTTLTDAYTPGSFNSRIVRIGIAKPHTVTYNANKGGGSVPSDSTRYHHQDLATVSFAQIPTWGKHFFLGWSTDPDAAVPMYTEFGVNNTFYVTADTTLYAVWDDLGEYVVSYDANNGVGPVPIDLAGNAVGASANTYFKDSPVNVLFFPKPGKSHSVFLGWDTDAEATVPTYTETGTKEFEITTNTVLYAIYGIDSHTLTYHANGATGSVPGAVTDLHGTAAVVSGQGSLIKNGYNFSGWDTDSAAATVVNIEDDPLTLDDDIDLYAVWTAKTNIKLLFDANGGIAGVITSQEVTFGATVGTLPKGENAPTRSGYTFMGWSTNSGSSNTVNFTDAYIVNFDPARTVYAVWKEVEKATDPVTEYTVTYHGNGNTSGEAPSAKTINKGTALTVKSPGSLKKVGYSFSGWATNPKAKTATYSVGQEITLSGDLELYAVWTKNDDKKPKIDPPVATPVVAHPVAPTVQPPAAANPAAANEDNADEDVPDEDAADTGTTDEGAADGGAATTDSDNTPELVPDLTEPESPTDTNISLLRGFSTEDRVKLDNQTGNLIRDLFGNNVPLGNFFAEGAWSLLSLLLSLIAIIISVLLIIWTVFKRKDKDAHREVYTEEGYEAKRKSNAAILRALTIIVGVLTPVVWLILDNINLPMAWINKWTLYVGIVFIVQIALLIVYKVRNNHNVNDGEAAYDN